MQSEFVVVYSYFLVWDKTTFLGRLILHRWVNIWWSSLRLSFRLTLTIWIGLLSTKKTLDMISSLIWRDHCVHTCSLFGCYMVFHTIVSPLDLIKDIQCETHLVATISKLTKNVKRIFRANVTNLLQACCSIPNNALPLFFKNGNAYIYSFKMRYFESWYHVNFLRTLKKSTKKQRSEIARIETNLLALNICLAFFVNFDILAPLSTIPGKMIFLKC